MTDHLECMVREGDGCSYMTEEELAAFNEAMRPGPFDSSRMKNKSLDIRYGPLPEHLIDIYRPSGDGPFPLIFYVHGGGWVEGSKNMGFLGCIIDAVDKGYAVAAVDYRLAPKVSFPEFLFDVKTAVRWARANAGDFGFDPDRFAMVGDSAGGYLALMAGFTAGHPEYASPEFGWAEFSDEIQVICDIFAPTMLVDPFVPFFRETGVKRARREVAGEPSFYELAFGTNNKNLLSLFSAISYVHKDIPPTLILHGLQDGLVPYQHSALLYERIREICGESRAELILYENRNHGDPAFNTEENCDTVLGFFDKHLR